MNTTNMNTSTNAKYIYIPYTMLGGKENISLMFKENSENKITTTITTTHFN